MTQKPLRAGKVIAKKQVANRHGKGSITRKGKFEKPPKKAKDLEAYKENKDLTKMINNTNESNIAAMAQNKGGRLKALKGAPPALAPKDKVARAKAAKLAKQGGKQAEPDQMDSD